MRWGVEGLGGFIYFIALCFVGFGCFLILFSVLFKFLNFMRLFRGLGFFRIIFRLYVVTVSFLIKYLTGIG